MAKGARRKRQEAERKLAAEASLVYCGANKRNGKPCKREAGWGTSHPGSGRCKMHGGATSNGAVAAAKEVTVGMATPIEVTPGQALAGVLHLAAGQLAYATWQVAKLKESEIMQDHGIHPWVRFQRNLMIDVAKIGKLAADAGIDERMASLAEAQTAMVAKLIEDVCEDIKITTEQKKALGPALRARLASGIFEGQSQEVSRVAV